MTEEQVIALMKSDPTFLSKIERMKAKDTSEVSIKNMVDKHPWTAEFVHTHRWDPIGKKYQITFPCIECGEEVTKYTSDLHVQGNMDPRIRRVCPQCKKKIKKDSGELLRLAMKMIREGKVNPNPEQGS